MKNHETYGVLFFFPWPADENRCHAVSWEVDQSVEAAEKRSRDHKPQFYKIEVCGLLTTLRRFQAWNYVKGLGSLAWRARA